ncbi:peroxisomal acyl-coenzyme A oxidase 3, partial [Brachionus plicatilis]
MIELNNLIEDVPAGGPLAIYREKASFNWKKLKVFLEDSELIEFKNKIWRNDPDFHVTVDEQPINELKKQTFKRVQKLKEYDFLPENE